MQIGEYLMHRYTAKGVLLRDRSSILSVCSCLLAAMDAKWIHIHALFQMLE